MANRVEKYIRFEDCGVSETGKTRIWRIFNFHHNQVVGWIKWYGGFRRYCFYTEEAAIYDNDCLRLVADFLEEQMKARKPAKQYTDLTEVVSWK